MSLLMFYKMHDLRVLVAIFILSCNVVVSWNLPSRHSLFRFSSKINILQQHNNRESSSGRPVSVPLVGIWRRKSILPLAATTTTTTTSTAPQVQESSASNIVSSVVLPPSVQKNHPDFEVLRTTNAFILSIQNAFATGSPLALFQWISSESMWTNPLADDTASFKESFQWVLSTFLDPKIQVFSVQVLSSNTVQLTYQLSLTQGLPWRPRIIIPATATISFNVNKQSVVKVEESWSISISEVFKRQIAPRFWDLYHVFATPHAEYPPSRRYPVPNSAPGVFKPPVELIYTPETVVYQAAWYAPSNLAGPPLSVVPNFALFGNITLSRTVSEPMYTMTGMEASSSQFVDTKTQEKMKLYRWRFHVPTAVQDQVLPLLRNHATPNSYLRLRPDWVYTGDYEPESDLESALLVSSTDINPLAKILLNLNEIGSNYKSDEDEEAAEASSTSTSTTEKATGKTVANNAIAYTTEGDTDIVEYAPDSLQQDRVQAMPESTTRYTPSSSSSSSKASYYNISDKASATNALDGNVLTSENIAFAEANDVQINRMLLLRGMYAIPDTPLPADYVAEYAAKQRVYGCVVHQPARYMLSYTYTGRDVDKGELSEALRVIDAALAAGNVRHPVSNKKMKRREASLQEDLEVAGLEDGAFDVRAMSNYTRSFTLSPTNIKLAFNQKGQPAMAMYDVHFQFRQTRIMIEVVEE